MADETNLWTPRRERLEIGIDGTNVHLLRHGESILVLPPKVWAQLCVKILKACQRIEPASVENTNNG